MIIDSQVDNIYCFCVGHYVSKLDADGHKSTFGQAVDLEQAVRVVDYIIVLLLVYFIVSAIIERKRLANVSLSAKRL